MISALVEGRNRHAALVAKICLSTGARWGEAESLEIQHLRNGQLQFAGTKSGKVRALPISPELSDELKAHYDPKETGNRLFAPCYSAFREGIEGVSEFLCKRFGLQLTEMRSPN
ncbi:hypothetical protein [Comamonas aquatica]